MSIVIVDEPEEARLQRAWEEAVAAPWRAMSEEEVRRRWGSACRDEERDRGD